jgi:CDP-diacylglycerol--glycerol-3-phosphate 3-phosphatidyltransferase
MTQSDAPRQRSPLMRAFLRAVDASRITPNGVTFIGFAGICISAGLVIAEQWVVASLVFVASGLVDSLDGTLARYQGRSTKFGAFLDSTLDRLAEGVILAALGLIFAQNGPDWAVVACFVALTGSFMVSYARARAEGLGIPGSSGGLMGRPERLVIVGSAIFLGGLGDLQPVLIAILAALSMITAVHRIVIVWRASDARGPRD